MEQATSYCVFRIDDQLFGVNVAGVEKIIRAVALTPLPEGPESVAGLINVEGTIFPVVDVRKKLRLRDRALGLSDRMILFKFKRPVCFIVNGVEEVVQFAPTEFNRAADIHPDLEGCIEGVGRLDDRSVIIVDLTRFLNEEEFSYMEKAVSEHG